MKTELTEASLKLVSRYTLKIKDYEKIKIEIQSIRIKWNKIKII